MNEIVVHCAATRPSWMQGSSAREKMLALKAMHVKENGWADIGYHFVIDRDGEIVTGRPLMTVGAHVAGRNAGTVGICLLGGYGSNANDPFQKNYTEQQAEALRGLIEDLMAEHPTLTKVSGHNQYAAKACPGFNVSRWYARKPERTLSESKTVVGGSASIVGTAGLQGVEELASAVQTAQYTIEPIADAIPYLRYLCIALALGGAALAIYARVQDWNRGRQ